MTNDNYPSLSPWKPLKPATVDESERELIVNDMLRKWEEGNTTVRAMMPGVTRRGDVVEHIRKAVAAEHDGVKYYVNDTYQVAVRELGGDMDMVHLSIKRRDRQSCHDWRDFQAIKNQLLGEECEAIELYPAESRRVDTANQYHLWGFRKQDFRFPMGYNVRAVDDQTTVGNSKQRPL